MNQRERKYRTDWKKILKKPVKDITPLNVYEFKRDSEYFTKPETL